MNDYFKKESKRKKLILDIEEFLEEYNIDYSRSDDRSEFIITECISCGHIKKVYLSAETGQFQCKYAGCEYEEGKSPYTFVLDFGGVSKKEAFELCFGKDAEDFDEDDIFNLDDLDSGCGHYEYTHERVLTEIDMPYSSVKIDKDKHKEAWAYLTETRGLSPQTIVDIDVQILDLASDNYNSMFASLVAKGLPTEEIKQVLNYLNRVIIPSKLEGKTYGFMARDYTGKAPKAFKALNSRGSWRSGSVWNYDNVHNVSRLIICEGIFDACKYGIDKAIAVFGVNVSVDQIKLIKDLNADAVYFAFDAGTEAATERLFDDLAIKYAGSIYKIILPEIVISVKPLLNKDIIEKIMDITGHKLDDGDWTPSSLDIPYSKYENLKRYNKNNILDDELLKEFVDTAEYKDAGDYSTEELEPFINSAELYIKKDDF